ncbi:MAG: DUF58 domain-containing protein [Acidobacteriota bacterium]
MLYVLAATTLLGVVGVLVPWLGGLALALDAALIVAWVVDAARAARSPLVAERTWPRLLMQGTDDELVVRVESGAARPLTVRLRETLAPALAARPLRRTIELPPHGAASWRVPLLPSQRGEQRAGPTVARVLGPWRLAWSQRELIAPETQRALPQVRWQGTVGRLLLLAHRRALGAHPQRLRGLGTEPYALREYLPGDPPVKIHWKASARHGRLVSREDTWERGARLVVLLDCGRSMAGRVPGAAGGDARFVRSKLDHALAAALALARVAVARGDRVTFVAFSDRVERTVLLHGGQRSVRAAYQAVYDLEARLVEPAFDLAAEAAATLESRRSTVVLLTSVVDLAAADLLRQALLHLERRHRPILVNLEDPELVALAAEPPTTPADAFAQVGALDIQSANRALSSRLRHAGIRVVSTAADRLALETLEAYLALFGVQRRVA